MSTTDEGPLHLDGQLSLTMVSIKLPTFQAKAQFEIKHVTTSMTKFHHCVAAIPQDVATCLIDLIRDPTADPYTTLRARLVQIYTLSNFQRYQALQSIPVTDQRPSELMDKMLVLLPEQGPPLVVQDPAAQANLHLRLPPQSVGIIASAETRLTSADHLVPFRETS